MVSPDAAVTDLLDALAEARLLRPPPVTSDLAVRVVGAGPLAGRTAHELLAAGFGTLYLADLPDRSARPAAAPRPGWCRRPA